MSNINLETKLQALKEMYENDLTMTNEMYERLKTNIIQRETNANNQKPTTQPANTNQNTQFTNNTFSSSNNTFNTFQNTNQQFNKPVTNQVNSNQNTNFHNFNQTTLNNQNTQQTNSGLNFNNTNQQFNKTTTNSFGSNQTFNNFNQSSTVKPNQQFVNNNFNSTNSKKPIESNVNQQFTRPQQQFSANNQKNYQPQQNYFGNQNFGNTQNNLSNNKFQQNKEPSFIQNFQQFNQNQNSKPINSGSYNFQDDHSRNINNKEPLVEIRGLTKKFKKRPRPAIDNISFNIYPGEFHAFIGANGAGKTTTIKSIISAYSEKGYSGTIKINGHLNSTVEAKSIIGYIPEVANFPPKMKTKDYLLSMAMLSGYTKAESKVIIDEILRKFKLKSLENSCPKNFSSGQKKKILLAQALIHKPKILILDEPAANLDPLARQELFELLVILQQHGTSIFISSHILDEIGKFATYTTILDNGQVVFDGKLDGSVNLSNLYKQYVRYGSVDNDPYLGLWN